MDLKIYIETYGCQMNVADSQVASAILKAAGCSFTEDIKQADVILINTCSVRDNAEKRVLGRLDVFRMEKKRRDGIIVGVLGCMAQRLKEKLLEKGFDSSLPTFTAILGVTYYLTLPVFEQTLKIISELSCQGSKLIFDFPDERTFSEELEKTAPRVKGLAEVTEKLGEPMLHGFSLEEVKGALDRNSFELASHYTPQIIQSLYFEGREDGLKAYENVHFVKAEKLPR